MTDQSLAERVRNLQAEAEQREQDVHRAQARLESARANLERSEQELRDLGVEPDQAQARLAELDQEIASTVGALESKVGVASGDA